MRARRTLHLVRGEARPAAVADGDWIVQLEPLEVLAGDERGEIDYTRLVALLFTADRVITW
ncbi:MAG: hypothetical protein KIT31_18765 [Deltaproteobacteria bacterium]|nr:hypothetical protein [Deltaproteobacteria bacterium]